MILRVKQLKHQEYHKNVMVRNFHSWLKNDLNIREQQIPTIISKLENNEAILPKYDAILIDEGQDFEGDWLRSSQSINQ